jgi:mannose-6-phosphate isomerase-like protein (cupin superfamily)
MIVNAFEQLSGLPLPATEKWKAGVPFKMVMQHGSMSSEVCALRGTDYQTVHDQDELYFIVQGEARFVHLGVSQMVGRGDGILVPAGEDHRFEAMSTDFVAWIVFWGPKGGETNPWA